MNRETYPQKTKPKSCTTTRASVCDARPTQMSTETPSITASTPNAVAATPIDLFAKLSTQNRRRPPGHAARRASEGGSSASYVTVHTTPATGGTSSRRANGGRRRALGPSVSIVGDSVDEEIVSREVPTTGARRRAALAKIEENVRRYASEGNKRVGVATDETTTTSASGDLMHEAERSATSSLSSVEDDGDDSREWGEGTPATEPLTRTKPKTRTERTPVTSSRFDEKFELADGAKRALRETLETIRKSGVDPVRVFASLAKTMDGSGDFDALVRAIDALESPAEEVRAKRLSFSEVATQTSVPTVEEDEYGKIQDDTSEDVSFGSAGESFEKTAEDADEVEGTFPACDCGEAECRLVEMHARGGPFQLPERRASITSGIQESVVETDDDESIAGTENGECEELDRAMDALALDEVHNVEEYDQAGETFEGNDYEDEDEYEDEDYADEELRTGTHIRFEDSIIADSPLLAGTPTPRAVRPRRKAVLESDGEDDETDAANPEDDVKVVEDDQQVARTRPRRAAAENPFTKRRNAFVDDDLTESEEEYDDDEYDDDMHSSDDDFIDDDDVSDRDYNVEYDSDAENVTPAPRKPSTAEDLAKRVDEKLVIDEYSPSNLHTPTPPKELSPTSAVKAYRPPPSHSKALQSALKSVSKKGADKFNFNRHKDALTSALFEEFNENVFSNDLPEDFEITWNNKLLTTAGLTHYKRSSKTGDTVYSARIELSTKVLDTVEKLEATLLHEMCHASAWLIDKTAKPPHGPVFKKWAQRAMSVYPETNVSTCHAYDIHQPYKWRCTRDWCRQEYGRHSKSIDITKKGCGSCGGKLEYLGKFKKNGEAVQARAPTAFSLFVKKHFKAAKSRLGASTPHKDIMKHLSQRWKDENGAVQID